MKLVAKSGGISAITLVADEIKPLNGIGLPTLINAIAERYKFTKVPTLAETDSGGAKFQSGALKKITLVELSLFNDGLHVTTTDTNDSDVVRDDFFKWIKKEFGFRDPITKPRYAYQSDVIVDFENSPDEPFRLFEPLMQFIQKDVTAYNGDKRQIEFARLDFGSDAMTYGANAQFIVERRAGVPWTTNRFFCKAYMQTQAHLKALTLLDKLLGQAKR